MQLFAKFKKILRRGFRATLNFQKFKVALNPLRRILNTYICTYFIFNIIIHQTHYQKSDWSRAFNQFTIACELDMINAISAADIAFIMSSSMSAGY